MDGQFEAFGKSVTFLQDDLFLYTKALMWSDP